MKKATPKIRFFFDAYQYHVNGDEIDMVAAAYTDPFMFGAPRGVHAIETEQFIKALHRRKEYFRKVGLGFSEIISLSENQLDEYYLMITALWKMVYKTAEGALIDDFNSTTYLLYEDKTTLKIAFQIDHQDLVEKANKLLLSR
ncbi:MAG TPA: hypothetical protein VGI43_10145 [Mucilaginibacter sp.]|jgi:hypothetical protein